MDGVVVRTTLSLIGPAILSVFGLAFVCAWIIDQKRTYLLLIATACAFFAFGAAVQVLKWPVDTGLNAMVSGALYTAAVLAAVEGILLRSERHLGLWGHGAIFVACCGLLWYFFYVDRSLIARIYIQNFGYGLIFLVAAVRLAQLRKGRLGDRLLFWSLLAFALHFFPRTVLTVGFSAPFGGAAFGNSVFWQALQLSMAVLGSGFALAILAAAVADMVDDLRHERDVDHLTGVLNRRGFEAALQRVLRETDVKATSLILCDIDHFKAINDTHGHGAGDLVLSEVARVLRQASRKRDIVGRMGGEEFAIFLPHTDGAEAYECAERLRIAIAGTRFSHAIGAGSVTVSCGIASGCSGGWEHLYQVADANLYEAKRGGRNRTMAGTIINLATRS